MNDAVQDRKSCPMQVTYREEGWAIKQHQYFPTHIVKPHSVNLQIRNISPEESRPPIGSEAEIWTLDGRSPLRQEPGSYPVWQITICIYTLQDLAYSPIEDFRQNGLKSLNRQ